MKAIGSRWLMSFVICKVGWLGLHITYYILHITYYILHIDLVWLWSETRIWNGFTHNTNCLFWFTLDIHFETEIKFLMEFILLLILDKEEITIWVCMIGVFYTRVLLPFIFSTELVFAIDLLCNLQSVILFPTTYRLQDNLLTIPL